MAGVFAQAAIQLQWPTVMREGSHQDGADRFSIAVIPSQEVVPCQSFEEPTGSSPVLIRKHGNQLTGVPYPEKRDGLLPAR